MYQFCNLVKWMSSDSRLLVTVGPTARQTWLFFQTMRRRAICYLPKLHGRILNSWSACLDYPYRCRVHVTIIPCVRLFSQMVIGDFIYKVGCSCICELCVNSSFSFRFQCRRCLWPLWRMLLCTYRHFTKSMLGGKVVI